MELRTASLGCAIIRDLVEAIRPVDTKQTHHGQHDAYTETGRALHVEGVELADVVPRITALEEGQGIDVGRVAQHQRVAKFKCEAVVGVTVALPLGDGTVVVSA